jgi:pyruvate kinase
MWKQTKIVATVGPASGSADRILELVNAGVDMFRINFSHGDYPQREQYIQAIRHAERKAGRPIAICGDLCGPKIRVGLLENGEIELQTGAEITIQRKEVLGTAACISTTLPELVDVVHPGETILLADGRLRLNVVRTEPPEHFVCEVVAGGKLANGKGVNLPQTQLPMGALTEKDIRDVDWIAERDFDYVALSFVQRPDDVRQLRELLEQRNCEAQLIAKIEKPQALTRIDSIIEVADVIMVARGDLGVEMDFPSVPIAQKSIASKCERAGRPCIIATEMLESMIQSPRATRAEVSDVANAVFDRVDAVMLSGESAIGDYPVAAVSTMKRTVMAADEFAARQDICVPPELHESSTTAALAGALRTVMKKQPAAAVAVFTVSGMTARLIAKNRPCCPILALSANVSALRRCSLYHGVVPRKVDLPGDTMSAIELARSMCKELGMARVGDWIIVLAGHPLGVTGYTNGLIVVQIE